MVIEYPHNLLFAIKGKTDMILPNVLKEDVLAGLLYALSTLPDEEKEVLRCLYQDNSTYEQTGVYLQLSIEQIRQIEVKAIRKLRHPSRLGYIQYGIAGYGKKREEDGYKRGYNDGYNIGYRTCAQDTERGTGRIYAPDAVLDLPIENLYLSNRVYNALYWTDVQRVRDLVAFSEERIIRIRNLGEKGFREIALKLQACGVQHSAWNKFL